jgi:hypothetical protein
VKKYDCVIDSDMPSTGRNQKRGLKNEHMTRFCRAQAPAFRHGECQALDQVRQFSHRDWASFSCKTGTNPFRSDGFWRDSQQQ